MLKLFKAKSLKNNTKQSVKNKNAKKQRGRSMVEMLGVLAIIGVLSIGSIQGYTMAMRRFRANEILNIANKYALTLYTACQNAMEKDPEQYYVDSRGYSPEASGFNWHCPEAIPFTDSGLGGLPNGAVSIEASYIWYETDGYTGEYIFSQLSGDFVGIKIIFDSKELCDTVQSIMGTELAEWDSSNGKNCQEKTLSLLNFMEN